jgi:hypothetical protein
MKRKKESKRFYFVEVEPQSCSPEEIEIHLRAFGKAFIQSNQLERWNHITLEKPEKAKNELSKLASYFDERFFRTLKGSESFPDSLFESFGNKLGIYFDGVEPACKITASEASSLAAERDLDTLFSITPGKLALFFYHSGDTLLCER